MPRYRRLPLLLLLAALGLSLAGEIHRRAAADRGGLPSPEALRARLQAAADREDRLVAALQAAAEKVASLPAARNALAGDRVALAALFDALDTVAAGRDESESLAVHGVPLTILAWTGRGAELRGLETIPGHEHGVFVLAGSVTTTLVATSPIREGGRIVGLASAALPVKVRRNIQNQYLSDFDRIAGPQPGLEVSYVDARDETVPAPAAPAPGAMETALVAPGGRTIGIARASAAGEEREREARESRYRRGTAALACLALFAWMASSPRPGIRARVLLGLLLLRLIVLLLGWPIPSPASSLLSGAVYASPLLGPLLASPLDLLLTAGCVFALSALVFEGARAPEAFRPGRAVAGGLLALPVLAGTFAWVADTSARCALDLETITLVPRSASHAVMHGALLLMLAAGFLLIASALSLGAPLPSRRLGRSLVLGGWLAFGLLAAALWPRAISLPLVPAIALVLLAGVAANLRGWLPTLRAATAEGWAGLALAAVALLSLLLYPSLVHYGEKAVRRQIERDHAPLILRQPQWRAFVLSEAQRNVDALNLLEDPSNGPSAPGLEELAFATWSASGLAGLGFSSAVEIQDASGLVISRFALNFPTLDVAGPPRPLPPDPAWKVARERLSLASAERAVLHARRQLVYGGESHGAIHLYLGDDAWNLPFVPGRDPYSLLFRSSTDTARDRPVELLVYDPAGRIAFSSADRPPALAPEMADRVRRSPAGLWTTVPVDGRLHHMFLFSDGQSSFGLAYPRLDASRYLAGHVEAFAGLLLLALVVLLTLVLVRTALGRPTLTLRSLFAGVRQRFILRLFVAFVAAAIIPVAVLEVVVRRFVADRLLRESEDQALERASVARKAVEDFAFYQRGEAAGLQPVTDPALVWVSSLIRNDLDVFGRGRLLASSKRELYASGLLLPRVPGAVFRSLSLEQASSALRTERIGSFSTLVVSVPVKLAPGEAGILSIPFPLRQRELQATLDDLDRNIRLASVAFLLFAAALAHSMSRRISGPIADLIRATRRLAAGDLDARVSSNAQDELRELVDSFNHMAGDLEQQRRDIERSNRLAAWAEMARQVAHEVKNPLTPIQLSAEHLRRVFGDATVDFPATLASCTDTILKQVGTLRRLVTEFSAFARPPAPVLVPEDLGPIVRAAVEPYLPGLPREVRLGLQIDADLPLACVDRRLFERAVLNLLENALQAVGERGTIAVRLRASPGRVELEVEDSGPGLDPEVRSRIFQPFFSTKTSGSGLGLALVKKIAEDHGGGVTLESPPDGPTRARLWLPAALLPGRDAEGLATAGPER